MCPFFFPVLLFINLINTDMDNKTRNLVISLILYTTTDFTIVSSKKNNFHVWI